MSEKKLVNNNFEKPIAIFGVLSDIQYADVNDRKVGLCSTRYYRNSLNQIRKAVSYWKQIELDENLKFNFILQLGDIIDSESKFKNESDIACKRVLNELCEMFNNDTNKLTNILNIWGNHEMYNFKRYDLVNSVLNTAKQLNQSNKQNGNYYSIIVTDKLKLICLDQYVVSILGYKKDDVNLANSYQILRKFNKNENTNSSENLPKGYGQFLALNGSIGAEQYEWLKKELVECENSNVKAIVCGHIPIHRKCSIERALAWDYKEILDLLRRFKNTVVCYFAGHYHPGAYHKDSYGIHHLTFKAILETQPDTNSFATIYVYENKLRVKGCGQIPSFDISLS